MFRAEPGGEDGGMVPVILRDQRAGHILGDVNAAVALGVYADNCSACRSRAAFRIAGSSFPRLEALRRIPRQAFGLKKYVSGTFSSKICDKKDSCPALGNTPELSVEKPVSHAPSVSQVHVGVGPSVFTRRRHLGGRLFNADDRFEDRLEVCAAVAAEGAGHVLPDDVSRFISIGFLPHFFHDADRFMEQAGAFAIQPGPLARDGHILARAAEGDDVHGRQFRTAQF